MPHRSVFRLYQRKRVININVNVVAAGVVSTLLVSGILWLLHDVFRLGWPTWAYTGFGVVADVVLDVSLFVALHWVANQWRPLDPGSGRERRELHAVTPPHLADTAQVQFERIVISPLYYVLAAAGTEGLQRLDVHPSWATFVGYIASLGITRVIHTLWGLRSGTYEDHHIREKKARIEAKRQRRRQRGEHDAPRGSEAPETSRRDPKVNAP